MYCKKCGAQIDDDAVVCPHCGVPTDNYYASRGNAHSAPAPAENDAPNGGFAVLGFFIPVIGLILYLVWNDTMPKRAKSCGKGALIGVIVWVALGIISTVLVFVIAFITTGTMIDHVVYF